MPREAWVFVEANDKGLLTYALERGFRTFVFPKAPGDLAALGRFEALVLDGDTLVRDGQPAGTRVVVAKPEDQALAQARAGRDAFVLVAATDWRIIPLENLIAGLQGSKTKVVAEARTAEEARTFLTTLEVGVHAVLLRPRSKDEVQRLRDALDALEGEQLKLEEAEVSEVRALGLGDRVCIDTCSLMQPGEGILVGSQSGGLFLVHAESLQAGYVAARPFRVNAGPVHAYALCPGGRTRYLSELAAGDEVLVVGRDGQARRAVIGRVKIEVRPLVLVRARAGEKQLATVLQNAETIRLCTRAGARSVAELQVGDKVLVRTDDMGRHFGMAVRETITER